MAGTLKNLDFVHIGLPKCMSTTLQNMWQASGNYCSCSATPLRDALAELIVKHNGDQTEMQKYLHSGAISFDPPKKNTVSVFTCEGMTYWWPNQPDKAKYIPGTQAYLSKIIRPHSNTVLIIVRDPIDWIYSAYAQRVREGDAIGLENYINRFREFIINSLDLKTIMQAWINEDYRVVVLPLELMKTDQVMFWEIYEAELQVRRPDAYNRPFRDVSKNETRYETLALHLQLNKTLELLRLSCFDSNFPDYDQTIYALEKAQKWGVRRGLTFIEDKELAKLGQMITVDENIVDKSKIKIDPELGNLIDSQFIGPLEQLKHFTQSNLPSAYRTNLLKYQTEMTQQQAS